MRAGGDNVGLLLRGLEKDQIERGMVLAKPGSIKPHTQFEAEVYVSRKRKRAAYPVLQGLSAAVLLPDHGRHGLRRAPADVEMGDAGGQHEMTIELITRSRGRAAGSRSGRRPTVGAGVVTKILK